MLLWSLKIYWLFRFFCIVDLCLLCRVSCFLASSGTSMVIFVGSFRRERGHCYIGMYWWVVDMAGSW